MRHCILGLICFGAFVLTTAVALGAEAQDANPYKPTRDAYRTELLIVGGSSSGTAAAITAGRLGIDTVWVLRAARDIGGLSTNAINPDSDLPIRYIRGLALEYDVVARYSGGRYVGGRHNGEGYFVPFHVLFRYTRKEVDRRRSLTVLSNLYPMAVEKEGGRVASVTFGHRLDAARKVVVRPQITIDAEIEGDVAQLAGVTMTLNREASVESDDPTRDRESYAGRIFTPLRKPQIGSLLVSGGPLMEGSTRAADERNMQRFLVQAEGPGVKVRINTLVEGQFVDEVGLVRRTHRRSFTLRLVARGEELTYFLDGRQVHRGKRKRFLGATRVGLLNGGGEASRFDNLEVRTVD